MSLSPSPLRDGGADRRGGAADGAGGGVLSGFGAHGFSLRRAISCARGLGLEHHRPLDHVLELPDVAGQE